MATPLWAPWRMEYILSNKDGRSCIFCDYAVAAEDAMADALVLVRTEDAFVVLNRYPFAAGHLLVVPRHHAGDLNTLGARQYASLFELTRMAAERLRLAVRAQGLNIGMNLGAVAGAGIAEHLHVHIVPRWNGDTNFMPVLADVRVMPQHLDDTFRHLAPHFADIPGQYPALRRRVAEGPAAPGEGRSG